MFGPFLSYKGMIGRGVIVFICSRQDKEGSRLCKLDMGRP
jgi:hypothetical protein